MSQEGEVYVLHNCDFRGTLVKIGRTHRTAEQRARELRTTGVPSDFVVLFSIRVQDAVAVEARVHSRFSQYRHEREFFRVSPRTAIEALIEEAENERTSLDQDGGTSVLAELKDRYGFLLDQTLTAVMVKVLGESTTVICEKGIGLDVDILRRDLGFIVVGGEPYFGGIGSTEAARLFLELDAYTLINCTELFASWAARIVAKLHEKDQSASSDAEQTLRRAVHECTARQGGCSKARFHRLLGLRHELTDGTLELEEVAGRLMLVSQSSETLHDIILTTDAPSGKSDSLPYAELERPRVALLDIDERVDVGYCVRPSLPAASLPRIAVRATYNTEYGGEYYSAWYLANNGDSPST